MCFNITAHCDPYFNTTTVIRVDPDPAAGNPTGEQDPEAPAATPGQGDSQVRGGRVRSPAAHPQTLGGGARRTGSAPSPEGNSNNLCINLRWSHDCLLTWSVCF